MIYDFVFHEICNQMKIKTVVARASRSLQRSLGFDIDYAYVKMFRASKARMQFKVSQKASNVHDTKIYRLLYKSDSL
jgi:hypothetical protein